MTWILVVCTFTANDCVLTRYERFPTEVACQNRATHYDPNRDFAKVAAYCMRDGSKRIRK